MSLSSGGVSSGVGAAAEGEGDAVALVADGLGEGDVVADGLGVRAIAPANGGADCDIKLAFVVS